MIDILGTLYSLVLDHPATAVVVVVAAYGIIHWARKKAYQSKAAGGA